MELSQAAWGVKAAATNEVEPSPLFTPGCKPQPLSSKLRDSQVSQATGCVCTPMPLCTQGVACVYMEVTPVHICVCTEVTPVCMCVHVCVQRSQLCACVHECVRRSHPCACVYMYVYGGHTCAHVGTCVLEWDHLLESYLLLLSPRPRQCPHVCCYHCRERKSYVTTVQSNLERAQGPCPSHNKHPLPPRS